MATNTDTQVIRFIAEAIGITNATQALKDLNAQAKLASGKPLTVEWLGNLKEDAGGARVALAKLRNEITGITATSKVTFKPAMKRDEPTGLRWKEDMKKWVYKASGMQAAKSDFAGFEGGPKFTPIPGEYISSLDKASTSMGELEKATDNVFVKSANLAARAITVIPIWMALRTVYQGVALAVSSSFTNWLELSEQMQRVSTVTRGSADDMRMLEDAVISYGRSSSRSFKEIGSSMYALGSAGLSVSQQMAGFEHIMNLSVGTMGNTEQIAKLVAGAFNVFGDSMKGVYTDAAKFQKIADILAYTYSKQQVELDEIATAMSYVASIGSLMNISFEDLVTTIGVLNTGMLKGSKSGTALMNSFVQLASNSSKLKDLGVIFDPNAPLDYRDVVEQLSDIYGNSTLSLMELKEVMEVFGRRGGRAMAQLITDFNRWKISIDDANASFTNYAENMREKMEKSLPNALKRTWNAVIADIMRSMRDSGIEKFVDKLATAAEKSGRGKQAFQDYPQFFPTKESTTDMSKFLDFIGGTPGKLNTLEGMPAGGPTSIAAPLVRYFRQNARGKETAKLSEGQEGFLLQLKNVEDILELRNRQGKQEEDLVDLVVKQVNYYDFLETLAKNVAENGLIEKDAKAQIGKYIADNALKTKDGVEGEKELVKEIWKEVAATQQVIELTEKQTKLKENVKQAILANYLAEQKAKGATESELLKGQTLREKQLGIELDIDEIITRRMSMRRAETDEMRLQLGLVSSTSEKLFDIAKTEGVEMAKIIGDVLSGQKDLGIFMRQYAGKKELEVLMKNFPDEVKQQQMKAFIQGNVVPGDPSFRGGGRIDFRERRMAPQGYDVGTAIQMRKAERDMSRESEDIAVQKELLRIQKERAKADRGLITPTLGGPTPATVAAMEQTTNIGNVTFTIDMDKDFPNALAGAGTNYKSKDIGQIEYIIKQTIIDAMQQFGGWFQKNMAKVLGGVDNQAL